jgi:hypothetical protein
MHPVEQQIGDRLAALPPSLAVIRAHAERYAQFCSSISVDGTLQLGHTPWVAPEAYAVRLYVPAKKAWIRGFRERAGRKIPPAYAELLLAINGGGVCGLELYGLAPSMQGSAPRLDRTRLQPLDLTLANADWVREYATDRSHFHFGSREWSSNEIVGYFWSDTALRAVRRSGEVVGEWNDLAALLVDELPRAVARFDECTPREWWH